MKLHDCSSPLVFNLMALRQKLWSVSQKSQVQPYPNKPTNATPPGKARPTPNDNAPWPIALNATKPYNKAAFSTTSNKYTKNYQTQNSSPRSWAQTWRQQSLPTDCCISHQYQTTPSLQHAQSPFVLPSSNHSSLLKKAISPDARHTYYTLTILPTTT